MAKAIEEKASIDVDLKTNGIVVRTVDNYHALDESINEISSFEASLSDRTETHSHLFSWRSRTDKSFVWFNSSDGSKLAESLFGRQNENLKRIK